LFFILDIDISAMLSLDSTSKLSRIWSLNRQQRHCNVFSLAEKSSTTLWRVKAKAYMYIKRKHSFYWRRTVNWKESHIIDVWKNVQKGIKNHLWTIKNDPIGYEGGGVSVLTPQVLSTYREMYWIFFVSHGDNFLAVDFIIISTD